MCNYFAQNINQKERKEVAVFDEQLDCVEGYKEFIHHDPQPETEPEVAPAVEAQPDQE